MFLNNDTGPANSAAVIPVESSLRSDHNVSDDETKFMDTMIVHAYGYARSTARRLRNDTSIQMDESDPGSFLLGGDAALLRLYQTRSCTISVVVPSKRSMDFVRRTNENYTNTDKPSSLCNRPFSVMSRAFFCCCF